MAQAAPSLPGRLQRLGEMPWGGRVSASGPDRASLCERGERVNRRRHGARRSAATTRSVATMPAIMSHPELWPMLRAAAIAWSTCPAITDDTARMRYSPTCPAAAACNRQALSGEVSDDELWVTARANAA